MRSLVILLLSLLPCAMVALPALRIGSSSVAFRAGECDTTGVCYACFRIPAIKMLPNGHLLAFAEARPPGCADNSHVRIVVRASQDNGTTWGPIIAAATHPSMRCGNPSPVVDASNGRVFLHYVQEPRPVAPVGALAFVTHSDDEGRSWTQPREITSIARSPGTDSYLPNCGGGVQLPDALGGPGRLLILAEEDRNRGGNKPGPHATFGAVPLYSDDHGKSWHRGRPLLSIDNKSHGPGEPGVALLGNSSTDLILSGRGASAPIVGFSTSRDGGLTWTKVKSVDAIGSGGCQSSIEGARLPSGGWGAMISSPVYPHHGHRSNLTIFVASAAGGFQTWVEAGLLWKGHAGYSNLLAIPDSDRRSFLCLFESGNETSLEVLRLSRFELVEH